MAEFVTVMKELKRLCDGRQCSECPMNIFKTLDCQIWIRYNPFEAERIIMQWAAENPIVTNSMKFKEVFGVNLEDRFPVSEHARAWLDAKYKEQN